MSRGRFGERGGWWLDVWWPEWCWGCGTNRGSQGFGTINIRWLSPNISYLYSGYWDITSRIRAEQFRSIIGGHSQAPRISLRTEKDPRIARLEVLHDRAGAGETVADEVLRSLQRLDEQHSSAVPPSDTSAHPLQKFQQTLTELESLLATMPTDPATSTSALPDDPVTRLNQQFTSEAGPRLPLENMPLFPWYRSLQVRTSRLLSATASGGGPQIPTQTIQRLVELQQTSTTQLLQYWWSQDLLVSTGPLPVPNVEGISEQPVGGHRRRLQSGLVGLWIAGVAAVLLAVPLR